MKNRKKILFEGLWVKYENLHEEQEALYEGKLVLPPEHKIKFDKLQSTKLAVLQKLCL